MAEEGFMKIRTCEKKAGTEPIGYRPTLKKGQNTPTVFFFFLNGGR
jgi:hypothetical protein